MIMLALALLGQSATSLADGRDVLADVEDNGRIDGCYSRAELDEGLDLLSPNDRLYGVKADLIAQARITNVERPGVPCGSRAAVGAAAAHDTSGGSLGVFLGAAVAVGAVAVGAGVWARRAGGPR
ncbi:MAG TPA: hypothetical protein VHK00_04170 [Miltoncostaeaceae bacterium]|nr:hypothetical protein [Miltoncostaeaceae bacterium]